MADSNDSSLLGNGKSAFQRLFQYAKLSSHYAIENFCTEALATCIESDPRPIIDLLRRKIKISRTGPTTIDLLRTQDTAEGTGRFDLHLVLRNRKVRYKIIFEIKVNAGLTGNQLSRYLRHLDKNESYRSHLILLSPDDLRSKETSRIQWIDWQRLWDILSQRSAANFDLWKEFRAFLEEIDMAGQDHKPVTKEEANALLPAHRLFEKARNILKPCCEYFSKSYSGLKLTGPKDPWEKLKAAFANHGILYVYYSNYQGHSIEFGLVVENNKLWLFVEIWTRKSTGYELIERCRTKTSFKGWRYEADGKDVFLVRRRALTGLSQKIASNWIIEQLKFLGRQGIVKKIAKLERPKR